MIGIHSYSGGIPEFPHGITLVEFRKFPMVLHRSIIFVAPGAIPETCSCSDFPVDALGNALVDDRK